jgi:hypothetical protein
MRFKEPRPWDDTQFQALLTWLNPDPNQAGAAYARLHRRLRLFFEGWRDAARHAEELADATIDRAISKLAEEPAIAGREAMPYIRAIANYILKEYRAQPQSVALTIDPPDERVSENERLEDSRCLSRCLGRLCSEDYELVIGYYGHDKAVDAARWRKEVLPGKLGKSYGALRVQVLRIRRILGDCIETCRKEPRSVKSGGSE